MCHNVLVLILFVLNAYHYVDEFCVSGLLVS